MNRTICSNSSIFKVIEPKEAKYKDLLKKFLHDLPKAEITSIKTVDNEELMFKFKQRQKNIFAQRNKNNYSEEL